MMFISMWRQGDLHCLLAGDPAKRTFELRLIDGPDIVRQQMASSSDEAVTLARAWQAETNTAAPSDRRAQQPTQ